MERIGRDELFIRIARLWSMRSTCPRASVGAIAVQQGRTVASGYVGAPAGMPHCTEVGCDMGAGHCLRSVHAEANVVAWAARSGISLSGASLYCTFSPCHSCAKLLVNAGISEVVYADPYTNDDFRGLRILDQSLVEHRRAT